MDKINCFENIIESMIDTLIVVNPNAQIKMVNTAAEMLLGYNKSELTGKPVGTIIPEDNLDFFSIIRDMIKNGSICNYNLFYINKKKERIPICFNGSVLRDVEGNLAGIVGVGRDMRESIRLINELKEANNNLEEKVTKRTSDLKRAKDDIEQAYNKLKQTQAQLVQSEKLSSIGQLAAGVAHEINNPIGFINSNLGTLDEYSRDILLLLNGFKEWKGLDESAGEHKTLCLKKISDLYDSLDIEFIMGDLGNLVRESKEGAERVKKIVQDLKDFARLDEAELKMACINQELDKTLNIIWNELKYKTKVTKNYGDLPMIECNPHQLDQAFMNIIINAAQAIEKFGEINIATLVKEKKIIIEISDTGQGIPAENIPKIFDAFFTTKEVGTGTGLGLNITYNIIKNHKGSIGVESEVGKGTLFIITLPFKL